MEAAEAQDAADADADAASPIARPRQTRFSIPGLRGAKMASRLTAPAATAKQTRAEKSSLMVSQQSSVAPPRLDTHRSFDEPQASVSAPRAPPRLVEAEAEQEEVEAEVRGGGGEYVDADAARRVAWIQHHVRSGNFEEASELGWDGDMAVAHEPAPTPPPSPPSPAEAFPPALQSEQQRWTLR